jgi:Fe-S-cluster containining protein
MSENFHELSELKSILEDLKFDAVCPDCRGQCCQMPWLSQAETHLAEQFPNLIKFVGDTPFFLDHERCAFLNGEGKCSIYDIRPLDCRLFPLDIIEEDGDYYWCIFTTCPDWRKMKELLEPLIPLLEKRISPSLWRQFLKQIRVTKEAYAPYKSGQYVTVKRFSAPIE